ncbi:2OG-Fe(II) oxygenase [Amphiplicatus metriothermophilus]|uniref:2OG-Fe(II) oxygenase superfamily protein n=1 Tax=Amphiplicatus metriothermophilus TaxID=1519374 RepID=A0A239PXY7_9PROT|nr:2OG-Fe(II) oxygenase [Amphiplicatus metriothermophilus]MBB5519925.1 hypothetical protein [Amphiplicatus metriothermophilus]SNT74826.1 2OG-Fe(II) oxygenase superfamily protein [Amphiplicatus metriothermophilus]
MADRPDLADLRRRAEAGEARAQYALAAALSGAGAREEAERWLRAAADGGEPDALYTLATRRCGTRASLPDAVSLLERAAAGGSPAAERLLAVLYADGLGVAADWAAATRFALSAARRGHAGAQREIAMLLFAADGEDADAADLIEAAARRDAVAAAVCARRAAQGRAGADRALARDCVKKLAAARYPNAGALAAALSAGEEARAPYVVPSTESLDWDRIAEKLAAPPPAPVASAERLCEAPAARVFRDAFAAEECEYVIAAGAPFLRPSQIADPRTGESRADPYRNSLAAVLGPVDLDLALVAFNRRLAALAGRPAENGEFLALLCYAPGQEYRPHGDWLPPGPDRERGGQRAATALLYLNDDYEGGETHFLAPDIRFRGATGDVLVFENAGPDGAPDPASRHAGLPVARGVKWLASKWFRERRYAF